ncbi:MAG: type I-E CRISPR-associated protein Cse1/CasA, partial [Exilibacterium sp.]
LQQYLVMPRRIRLHRETEGGDCDLCGSHTDTVVKEFRTQNYGVNYDGPWLHPLTPYRFDPKDKKFPLPLKGQPGGLGYRHWLGLVLKDENNGDSAARIVNVYMDRRGKGLRAGKSARLWCFGYDMDNMKARCWYDSTMPLFNIPTGCQKNVMHCIERLLVPARDGAQLLRRQVKAAWFRRPEDIKGDMSMIDKDYWLATESAFYELVGELVELAHSLEDVPAKIAGKWWKTLRNQVEAIFGHWALSGPSEDMDMQRIILAKHGLMKKFVGSKGMKALAQRFSDSQQQDSDTKITA